MPLGTDVFIGPTVGLPKHGLWPEGQVVCFVSVDDVALQFVHMYVQVARCCVLDLLVATFAAHVKIVKRDVNAASVKANVKQSCRCGWRHHFVVSVKSMSWSNHRFASVIRTRCYRAGSQKVDRSRFLMHLRKNNSGRLRNLPTKTHVAR